VIRVIPGKSTNSTLNRPFRQFNPSSKQMAAFYNRFKIRKSKTEKMKETKRGNLDKLKTPSKTSRFRNKYCPNGDHCGVGINDYTPGADPQLRLTFMLTLTLIRKILIAISQDRRCHNCETGTV
jgi:hypothetical protein